MTPLPSVPDRRVAGERVREREAVVERPEDVGLEVVERLVQEGVTAPADLPRLDERVADVPRNVARHVQRERPVHRDGEQAGGERGKPDLAPREGRARGEARGRASARAIRGGAIRGGAIRGRAIRGRAIRGGHVAETLRIARNWCALSRHPPRNAQSNRR